MTLFKGFQDRIKHPSFLLSLLCSSLPAFSAQALTMCEQERLTALISSQELNRLQVIGERIASVFGPPNTFSLEHEEVKGQVFLKVYGGVTSPLDISVVTESGLTQDLRLKISGKEGQTLLLKPSKASAEISGGASSGTSSSESVALIRLMIKKKPGSSYGRQQVHKDVPRWRDLRVTHLETWKGSDREGRLYQITNTGNAPLVLQESQFCLSPRIRALSLEQHCLTPGESTRLWEVISHD